MNENELSKIAVEIAIEVHKELGPGLLESVYEEAFAMELVSRNLPFTRQQAIQVFYKGVLLGKGFRADFIINDKLLIEIKSVADLEKIFFKTMLTYLKFTNLKLGLLMNFNSKLIKEGTERVINGYLEN